MLDQHLLEVAPRMAGGMFSYLFWGTANQNFTALITALRPKINNPVGAADHIKIVFNNKNRITFIHQSLHYFH